MSHISKIEMTINDLTALKRACGRLSIRFMEDQKTYLWYSGQNPCDHAIKVPGAKYEIGVLKTETGYELAYDGWQSGGLSSVLGSDCGKLKQAYAVERVRAEAKRKRMRVTEKKTGSTLRLILSV